MRHFDFQFTVCFWMKSGDKDNYGTPFSYATLQEDNEVIPTFVYYDYVTYDLTIYIPLFQLVGNFYS